MRQSFLLGFFLALGLVTPAFGQQPPLHDELLDHVTGNWIMKGEINHKPTVQDVTADWVLAHQYVRLQEVSREKRKYGSPVYESMFFIGWNAAESQYGSAYLDSYGGITSFSFGLADRRKNEIPFLYSDGKDGKEKFYDVMSYDSKSDSWKWKMDSDHDGKRVPFALLVLTRKG